MPSTDQFPCARARVGVGVCVCVCVLYECCGNQADDDATSYLQTVSCIIFFYHVVRRDEAVVVQLLATSDRPASPNPRFPCDPG